MPSAVLFQNRSLIGPNGVIAGAKFLLSGDRGVAATTAHPALTLSTPAVASEAQPPTSAFRGMANGSRVEIAALLPVLFFL